MNDKLYNKPRYYHLAFPAAYKMETAVIATCFSKHVSFPVKHVLEAACGTGRMLVELPKHGYLMTGYDLSPEMVAYSTKRLVKTGLEESVTVVQGDMASIRFEEKYDSALNLINSIGYLTMDDDILGRLKNTGDSLRRGGIYIFHLGCASEEPGSTSWQVDADGVRGTVTWEETSANRERKLSHQYFKMDVNDNGTHISFRDDHTLRLWLYEDLKYLIKESEKFALEAIYDEDGNSVSPDTNITGTHGNLFYVLKTR